MLPFTKRPGRGDDAEAQKKEEVDSSPVSEGTNLAAQVKRSAAPSALRPPAPSLGEEDMTSVMHSRSLQGPGLPVMVPPPSRPLPNVRPLASIRPAMSGSARPSPMSSPPSYDDDDNDEGRTVVRGMKPVKRSGGVSPGASLSPSAAIKATLEAGRPRRREHLGAAPPHDLLENPEDIVTMCSGSGRIQPPSAFDRTMALDRANGTTSGATLTGQSTPPGQRGGAQSHYSGPPSAGPSHERPSSGSVPSMAVPSPIPAHFKVPQASDSPPMAMSGKRSSGRPVLSWVAALMACGLFVGVASAAVAQSGESIAETTASFVDPSRAPAKATAGQISAPMGVAATATGVPGAGVVPGTAVPGAGSVPGTAVPGAAVSGVAIAPDAVNTAPAAGVVAAGGSAVPGVAPSAVPGMLSSSGIAPVAGAGAATPAPGPVAAPVVTPPSPQSVAVPSPVAAGSPVAAPSVAPAKAPQVVQAAPKPSWRSAAPAPKPSSRSTSVAAAPSDEEPKKAAAPVKKSSGRSDADDETKKALEALQKAQLESSSSFGDK